ncbi:type IV secretion system protein VirB10 [Pseudomonas sp. DCB_CB]|uniref:type IV secretion system protein VirB10 n=1 Tax=unclassified Pseudomonas TaxID=196821 RepID=UPI0022488511|nr:MULTISPECIES: type IV secretion system protein VirB10 [unclassified Pseudomonas]MCX2694499.1 type IV secretion system protein VirB10 [Pseudomonas sp. DCB_BZ]MCX2859671.1 type IV secretion system protein VirB10 [Pseudomonas sp. DCB_CB]
MTIDNLSADKNGLEQGQTKQGKFGSFMARARGSAKAPPPAPDHDVLPSVNRKAKANKAVTLLGYILIFGFGAYVLWQVNSESEDPKSKPSAAEQKETNNVHTNTLPPFTAAQPQPDQQGLVPALNGTQQGSGQGGLVPPPIAGGGPGPAGDPSNPGTGWLDRKMKGNVMLANSQSNSRQPAQQPPQRQIIMPSAVAPQNGDSSAETAFAGGGQDGLASRLQSTKAIASKAQMLPNRDFLVTLGTPLECTLETALDTTLPGLTKCVLTNDLYSDNGRVLLAESGSELTGEQQGNIKQGEARVFVLWTRLKTLNGAYVDLNSPGTDSLGRSGLEGWVDNHFAERFKSAILMSIVQASIKIVVERAKKTSDEASIVADSSDDSTDVVSQTLESTINIPPTLLKNQGERVQVMVARDLDFSSVYGLKVK